MKNSFAINGFVFVDDRKCWALNNIGNAQFLTYCLDKRGFSRAHTSIKGKNPNIRVGG